MKEQKLPIPAAPGVFGNMPETPVSNDGFADNAAVRRVLADCLERLGQGRLAPSLQKRILQILHPGVTLPKRYQK